MDSTVITVEEVKAWVLIDDDADDAAIELLILAAQEQASARLGPCLHQHDDAQLRSRKLEHFVGLDAAAEEAARFGRNGQAGTRDACLAAGARPAPFPQRVAIGVARSSHPIA
ncbi:phage head-tail connector protein [Sphingomonas faeni]|uniref:phage head-tail connector protein n=1 Tax=Sphingomonas faeni TaxID=185950 RepID=UPI0034A0C86D